MRIVWTPQAQRDLDEVFDYVAPFNATAARSMYQRIRERVRRLTEHPRTGRPGREPGTRELVITGTPYLVPYRVIGRQIQILAVIHGARRWPARR
jgi:toxin ParE1/3/4